MTQAMRLFAIAAVLAVSACGSPDRQFVAPVRALSAGPQQAGVGDAVLDLKLTEPLPNIVGWADVFGPTRDAGRITIRYLGERGGVAYFSRPECHDPERRHDDVALSDVRPKYPVHDGIWECRHGSGLRNCNDSRDRHLYPAFSFAEYGARQRSNAPVGACRWRFARRGTYHHGTQGDRRLG